MAIITCPECGQKNRVDDNLAGARQPVCGRCGAELPTMAGSQGGAGGAAADGTPVEVTDATLQQTLSAAGDRPVLVDCWADWCPPCRKLAPVIDRVAAETAGRFVIAKLDVDDNPRTAQHFRVEGIPTLLIFKQGKLVDQLVGYTPAEEIIEHLAAQE